MTRVEATTGTATLGRLDLPAADAAARARLSGRLIDLQARARPPNVFHDLDVLEAATGIVGPVTLHWLERDGRLMAALPVMRRRTGFGLAGRLPHGVAHDYGPAGTPLIDPEVASADLARLVAAARGAAPALVLPFAEADSPAVAVLLKAAGGGDWANLHSRAKLDFAAHGRDIPAVLSAKRLKEWGRQARRLAEHGALEHRRDTAPDAVAAAFDEVMALEARGWKGRRATALAQDGRGRAFGTAVLTALSGRGAVAVDRLLLDGRAVAALVSFRLAGRWWIWKTAYDEDFARFSPGVQLMLAVTRTIAADAGIDSADSLATPDHPMIDALWPGRLAVGTLILARPGSGAGQWLKREMALAAAAKRLARRLLKR